MFLCVIPTNSADENCDHELAKHALVKIISETQVSSTGGRETTRILLLSLPRCQGPALAGLRVPKEWMAQVKNEGSDTKFDAGERPALVGLTEL